MPTMRRRRLLVIGMASLLLLSRSGRVLSAAAAPEHTDPPLRREAAKAGGSLSPAEVKHKSEQRQRGLSSWYGRRFHGRKTASGEVFDMHAMTAAHRTLAFQTWVRVTNLANGKQVIVRINDRGPHRADRIIDLSQGAARALGF